MNPCFLLENPEQTPLTRGTRVGVAHRRREETWRLPVRPLEAVLHGPCAAVYGKLRRSRRLDAVESGCTALSIVKHGDLMVVANADDSRVVLGTATDDGAITGASPNSRVREEATIAKAECVEGRRRLALRKTKAERKKAKSAEAEVEFLWKEVDHLKS
uniref:protein-serine/threonine phosphatase n=1 Tax=Zea mays TaxID=4577 RepID=A0A804RFX5_MAIZE